ncbi:MAG: DUF3558 family protein [Actinobacteria bacterium]|nr:DUF3558 family protein [Actinomycetota bacterium]
MRRLNGSASALIGLAAAGLILTGCGSSGGSTDAAAPSSAAAAPESPAASAAASESVPSASAAAPTGEVPDPCALLTADEISAITGSDPGTPKPNAVYPDIRKICNFEGGLILAVEVAADYDGSVAMVKGDTNVEDSEDVSGVGDKAFFSTYTFGATQILAVQGDYFIGVTSLLDKEKSIALAQAMLAAL